MITITIILEERDENVTVRCEAKSEPPNPGTEHEIEAASEMMENLRSKNNITDIIFDK